MLAPGPQPPAPAPAPGALAAGPAPDGAVPPPLPLDETRWGLRPPAAPDPAPTGQWPANWSPEEVVHGIPVRDAVLARNVRRVVVLAAVGATYWIGTFIWRLLAGTNGEDKDGSGNEILWSDFSQLVIQLSIPACGYYGALYAHRTLVFFFCGANLIFVVASFIQFFRLVIRFGTGNGASCEEERRGAVPSSCEILQGNGLDQILLPTSMLLLSLLCCLSFGAGKRLYQGLRPLDSGRLASALTPIVGEVLPGLPDSAAPQPESPEPPPVVVRAAGVARAPQVAPETEDTGSGAVAQ